MGFVVIFDSSRQRIVLGALALGLGACDEAAPRAGGGDLVTLAAQADQAALQAALDAAGPDGVASLRYGPAGNGLAHAAVANQANPEAVGQVARAGADVNLVDANGRTPLHFAIEARAELALTQLLALGANPDIRTGSGQSPRAFCEDALKQVPDYAICRKMLNNLR